jgi:tRNA-specific 2-thiouridylase
MRVMVAMSGGVDSSVAAALLAGEGHDVTGVTLRLWGGVTDSGCCSVSDVEDARRVAAQLDLPHYVFDYGDEFAEHVVDPYVRAYANGHTPNPCVACNQHLKFGRLLERAELLGFDALATGHHARLRAAADGTVHLVRAADAAKDQSYVLVGLTQDELRRLRFPIGELTKAEVRERAAALGLRTATKPESMDVCFITRGGRTSFLDARVPATPGRIVDTDGTEVGAHEGVRAFTVGQRRGLAVATGARRYVVDVDATTATVTIGGPDDLARADVHVGAVTTTGAPVAPGTRVDAQVRAHGTPQPGTWWGDRVVWDVPQPRVAPGQTVALYDGDRVLGAGTAV